VPWPRSVFLSLEQNPGNEVSVKPGLAHGTRLRSGRGRSVVGSLAASGGLQRIVKSAASSSRSLGPEDRGHLALLIVISGVRWLAGTLGLPSAGSTRLPTVRLKPGVSCHRWPGWGTPGGSRVCASGGCACRPRGVRSAARPSGDRYLPSLTAGHPRSEFGRRDPPGAAPVTAFNLLRILPSTAYVASVVIVYVLNASSLVVFMAVWR
jgi:hypothetical protein